MARVLGFELFGHRFDLTVTTWLPADERSCCWAFLLDFLDLKVDEMYFMWGPPTHIRSDGRCEITTKFHP